MIQEHIGLLGFKVQDKVTGYKGVVTSISFDLYGCIQAIVSPIALKEGRVESGTWFDVARLKVLSKKRVMELPNFVTNYSLEKKDEKEKNKIISKGKKGCANKPIP